MFLSCLGEDQGASSGSASRARNPSLCMLKQNDFEYNEVEVRPPRGSATGGEGGERCRWQNRA